MNISFCLQKEEKNLAKICFYGINEKLIYENNYPFDNKIREIIEDFLKKSSKQTIREVLQKKNTININNLYFYIKNKDDEYEQIREKDEPISLYLDKIIDSVTLCFSTTYASNFDSLKIYVIYKKNKYKHIAENMKEYIINRTHLIGKPRLNSLEYYLYNKNKEQLTINKYSQEDEINLKLQKFSTLDVYCNAKNYLYIYENNPNSDNNNSNRFFSLNLVTNKLNLISSKFPKRILHSMIYIPECYIFIIGGKDEKEVLIYKIKENNNIYKKHLYSLPCEMLEPSLIDIDNKYLYIFENSTLNLRIFRTTLKYISPFEEVKLKNCILMNQIFFGVVKNKNSILFLGGQMIESYKNYSKNCFGFRYDTNELIISKIEFKSYDFSEKTFIPIGNDDYMQIIEYKNEDKYKPKIIYV